MIHDISIPSDHQREARGGFEGGSSEDKPSAQEGSICPKLRDDVAAWLLFKHADPRKDTYIVGNREIDKYISVPAPKLPVIMSILELFDGQHSIDEVQNHFRAKERKRVDVGALYRHLRENNLIASPESANAKKGDIERMSVKLFGISTVKAFASLSVVSRLLFPWGLLVMLLFILTGTPLAIQHHRELLSPLTTAWSGSLPWRHVAAYALLLFVSVLLHEIAHGVAGSHYGLHARRFQAVLYLGFVPLIYLRIPGLYTLVPRARIAVWSAGIYWNVTFASLGVVLFSWCPMSAPAREIWLLVALANYSIAIVNLFPFLPTDGYFIASTLLKTHNVRINAWKEFGNFVAIRRHRFTGVLRIYLVGTAGFIAFTLWRNVSWVEHLRHVNTFWGSVCWFFLLLPWLVLLCRWALARRILSRD